MQTPRPVTIAAIGCGTALLLYALAPSPARAWGAQGHRVAGELAERRLSPAAREAVGAILGSESLATASTYADRMRSDPAPFWQNTAGAFHYIKATPGTGYRPGDAPPQGDAYTALADFARDIRSASTSSEQRQLALRFSIHIVQDLHQPLHAGEREDRGGNDFRVTFEGQPSNLHRVWDSGLLGVSGRDDRAWVRHLEGRFPATTAAAWQQADPLIWIRESTDLTRSIYPESAVLDQRYVSRHRDTVERRLAQAGVRTAAYLNDLFDPGAEAPPPAPAPETNLWTRLKNFLKEIVE